MCTYKVRAKWTAVLGSFFAGSCPSQAGWALVAASKQTAGNTETLTQFMARIGSHLRESSL